MIGRLVLRRAAAGLLLLLGVSVFGFLLAELVPGDPFDPGRLEGRDPAAIELLRARYGLDRPLPQRYLRWVSLTVRGDLGYSLSFDRPVAEILRVRARNTLLLTGIAVPMAWLLALVAGIWAASRRGRWGRTAFAGATSLLLAVPDLVLALGLLLVAVQSGLLPTGGLRSLDFEALGPLEKARDLAAHLVLPAAALVLSLAPRLARYVQASVAEVLAAPFVDALRAAGIPRRRLLLRYVLPAAGNPLASLVGFSVASLLSASLLVEIVMSWPGLGPALLDAILARDVHLVIGAVLVSTLLLVAGNLIADLLIYALDPRIRSE